VRPTAAICPSRPSRRSLEVAGISRTATASVDGDRIRLDESREFT
jgi:hypothetical protein